MRALIVDDSRAMRMMLRNILRGVGVETLEAAHGREALDRLKEAPVDFVVCDWHMPEMDGCELVRAIRSDSPWKELPVLMVTSEGDGDKVSSALDAGANEYVMKPFTQNAIVQKLQMMGISISG